MQWVYNNKKKAQTIGKNARKTVIKNFGLKAVGEKMKTRLQEIQETLDDTEK